MPFYSYYCEHCDTPGEATLILARTYTEEAPKCSICGEPMIKAVSAPTFQGEGLTPKFHHRQCNSKSCDTEL